MILRKADLVFPDQLGTSGSASSMIVQVGTPVEFVDANGLFHHALVNKVVPAGDIPPMINLVYIDLESPVDNLGHGELHVTSVPHKSSFDSFYWCHIRQNHD